jgi:hypothetical protein
VYLGGSQSRWERGDKKEGGGLRDVVKSYMALREKGK